MALTYTEIEEGKSLQIWVFFMVVLVFYFLVAAVLGNISKAFFVFKSGAADKAQIFLTQRELLYLLFFALSAAVIHAAYSVANAMPLITRNLDAHNVDASDKYHSRFKAIVDEVNVATGNKYRITPIVIPTVAMNAFAVSGTARNAIIGVTEGLLSKLNRQQLEAVIAHECGHIASGDSFQTTVGCALFGIYAAILAGLRKVFREGRMRTGGRGGGILLLLLIIYLALNIMQFFYNLIRLFISRNRELRADAIAVRLTRDPVSLAEALYLISRGWRGFGYIDRNLESLFIINPAREPADESEGFFADLFSTHPPVSRRMAILAEMAHLDVKNIERDASAGEESRNAAKNLASGAGQVLNNSPFKCPKCVTPLIEEGYEGAVVHRCGACEGILSEKERIPRILIRQEKEFPDRIKKMAELTQRDGLCRMRNDKTITKEISYLKCPKCGNSMLRNFYTMAYLVEVDRCESCGFVWFDKDEFEILQCLIEGLKTEVRT